jgi:hypothetical protein
VLIEYIICYGIIFYINIFLISIKKFPRQMSSENMIIIALKIDIIKTEKAKNATP